MRIGVPKESRSGETRVAATPDSVKKLIKKNFKVAVERGAGALAHYPDAAYQAAGAEIVDTDTAFACDAVTKIHKPNPSELKKMKKGGVLHYYAFGDSRMPYEKAEEQVKEAAAKAGRKAGILFRRVVRPYSKTTVQIVVDAKII